MIDLTEYNFVIHDGNKKRFVIPENELNPQGPWLPQWMHLAQQAIRTRGGEVEAADHLERWVADHGAFENVVHRSFWFQASPWNTGMDPESVRQNEIAKVMREDMLVCFGCFLESQFRRLIVRCFLFLSSAIFEGRSTVTIGKWYRRSSGQHCGREGNAGADGGADTAIHPHRERIRTETA